MSIPLLTPAQVRALDARAIEGGVPEDVLMERAAGHLARATAGLAGRAYGLRVGIACGKGNNGGDGLAAARRLADDGAHPRVGVVEGGEGAGSLTGLPARQLERWRQRGGRVEASIEAALAGADVVLDCLLGTGTSGEPRAAYKAAVAAVNAARAAGAAVVACDQPTGVDAATGAVPGDAVRADLTVTLGAEKLGLRLWPARGHCGRIVLGDIGLAGAGDRPAAELLTDADAARLLPPPDADVHKRSRGVVVVLAGSAGMSGAAVLSARGAYAAGAGLVTVCTAAAARPLVASAVPEVLTVGLPDDPDPDDPDDLDDLDEAFEAVSSRCARADALALGPGLGTEPRTVALVRRLVREVEVPIVLDADGLNAFAGESAALADRRSPMLTLTPHAGEYARLASSAWADRATGLTEEAARWHAVVVAKGPGTVTAAPDGRSWVNDSGGVALATGGTGDVLTGILGALVAAGADPARVAAGVHLHGRAGEAAARAGDPRSVTAGAVADAVPQAWRTLEAAR